MGEGSGHLDRKHARARLTPESVTTWLFVILCSVFLANAMLLWTAPRSGQSVANGVPTSTPSDTLLMARNAAAETGGRIGLALAVLATLGTWWVRRRRTPQSWHRLLEFFGVVAVGLLLALLAQLFLARHVREREPWLTFQALIPTAVLFLIMWIQIWIAVRRSVWLDDPKQVERVFE